MSHEDEMAMAVAQMVKESALEEQEITTEFEKHYNHYGNRGYVDLFIEKRDSWGDKSMYVIEFKSESAVRNATGANEIIRQFNKHREYFRKGSDAPDVRGGGAIYELVFEISDYTMQHLSDNLAMYESVAESSGEGDVLILLRHPDCTLPAHVTGIAGLRNYDPTGTDHEKPFELAGVDPSEYYMGDGDE